MSFVPIAGEGRVIMHGVDALDNLLALYWLHEQQQLRVRTRHLVDHCYGTGSPLVGRKRVGNA
jgi:hypothetical protein